MKLSEILKQTPTSFSFEFFPPKNEEGETQLFETIGKLKALHPSFVSVTYGAGGSTRRKTVEWVSHIRDVIGIEAAAHLTGYGSSPAEIDEVVGELMAAGLENIIALRGDPPRDAAPGQVPDGPFRHASDLIRHLKKRGDFAFAVAGYPEKHPEAATFEQDLAYLKQKVDLGAACVITQLFFDNEAFFRFRDAARKLGITAPILAGIMPVTNAGQILRFTQMCGASIPVKMAERLDAIAQDRDAVVAYGIEYGVAQCEELLREGVEGIHFYTLNRSYSARKIFEAVRG